MTSFQYIYIFKKQSSILGNLNHRSAYFYLYIGHKRHFVLLEGQSIRFVIFLLINCLNNINVEHSYFAERGLL